MKKTLVLLILCLLPTLTLLAQRISRDYHDCPMSSVLADLSHVAQQRIIFIYNDLEDYLVTQRFDSFTVVDAIRACIGHYPISLTVRGDSILLVECMQKTKYKLIGRLVDEKDNPVADANITLTTDTATTARGISNQSGRFVIPTNHPDGTLHVSHVAYQPLSLHYTTSDIGTLRLKPADIRLDSVRIMTTKSKYSDSRYFNYANKIEEEVWNMKLPLFHIDTLPAKYRHAPAIVLADYDCIEYNQMERKTSTIANRTEKWIRTKHFHRTRYYINSPEAATRLSAIPYSHITDVTDFTFHKATVMGIRITRQDGTMSTISTHSYFKPKIRSRHNATNDTDTIFVGPLRPGDILDVFVYHHYQESMSPYRLSIPANYPLLNYEGRAVSDVSLKLKHSEYFPANHISSEVQNGRNILLYKLSDYDIHQLKSPLYADVNVEFMK